MAGIAPEVGVIVDLSLSQLEDEALATTNDLLSNDGVQHCINVLWQVLNQEGLAILNAGDDLQA